MICRRYSQYSKVIFICLMYVALTVFPVIFLLLTGNGDDSEVWNLRRAGLMVNSLLIALLTVFFCLIIAVFASVTIHALTGKQSLQKTLADKDAGTDSCKGDENGSRQALRWYFLLLAPVPPYIYALSYMNLLRFAGRYFPGILRTRMAGIMPCVVVECLAYLPFACAVALIALDQINEKEWNAALLFDNADRVFFRVILPEQIPWLLAAGAVIFALSVTDYSIPSLFQVNVYSMEIFSDYSAAGQSVHSLRLSFPLMLISSVLMILGLMQFGKVSHPMKTGERVRPVYSVSLKAAGGIAVLITILQIVLPLLSFVPYLTAPGEELVSASKELWNSCAAGILAVILLTIPSAAMALKLSAMEAGGKLCKLIAWVCAILPLCIPGVLTGIGLLKLFSSTGLYVFRTGVLMPAAGLAVRYMPFAVLIQYGCYLRMDRERIGAASLLQSRKGQAFFRVQLPLMTPGLIISGIVVFLLTLGDVGTSLVLMSAGREPMSVKIYNYLHYGSSEKVTVFCMMQTGVCVLLMLAVYMAAYFAARHGKESVRQS